MITWTAAKKGCRKTIYLVNMKLIKLLAWQKAVKPGCDKLFFSVQFEFIKAKKKVFRAKVQLFEHLAHVNEPHNVAFISIHIHNIQLHVCAITRTFGLVFEKTSDIPLGL